jgi:UDP-N-acetylmuramoylalanine--D-glutamate ligase
MNDSRASSGRDKAYWEGRRVVVVGAGLSGVAAARLLLDCGALVTLNDERPEADITDAADLLDRGATLVAGDHPDELWRDAQTAVFSPGIRPDAAVATAVRRAGVEMVAEIEIAEGLIETPIIAITGSNGKSTVTSMVGAILAEAGLQAPVCGNIGTALSAAARAELVDDEQPDAYVVEVSSFQAHGIDRFRPRLAAILNIQPDHIDWHGTVDAYADAKLRLVRNMGDGDTIVYNRDDAGVAGRLAHHGADLVPFAQDPADVAPPLAWVADGHIWWWAAGGERHPLIGVDELGVIGPHNQANACAAAALASLFGVAPQSIARGLAGYRALEHRMEPCGDIDGVRCINDSKATNVDATLAALSGFDHGVWLILGGRDKGADFTQLLPVLDHRIAGILLIGEASDAIAAALARIPELDRCETLARAVARALASAVPGDTILLSPACTSFDQYADFEERGRRFKELVAARAVGEGDTPERLMEGR